MKKITEVMCLGIENYMNSGTSCDCVYHGSCNLGVYESESGGCNVYCEAYG